MNTLSTRARHVLFYAAYGFLPPGDEPWLERVLPHTALRLLRRRAKNLGCSVSHVILRAKGGGRVTNHELCKWMGIPEQARPHACICRDCGRRMGGAS